MPRNFIFRINNCSLAERGDDLSRCESHSPSNNIKVTKYSRLPWPLLDVYVQDRVLQLTSVFKISPTITLPGIMLPRSALCVYLLSVTLNQQNKCRDSQLSLFVLHRAVQSSPPVFLLTLPLYCHCRAGFIIIDMLGSWVLSKQSTEVSQ